MLENLWSHFRFRIISAFGTYSIYHISSCSWKQPLLPYLFSSVRFYFSFSFHSSFCLFFPRLYFLSKVSFPPIILTSVNLEFIECVWVGIHVHSSANTVNYYFWNSFLWLYLFFFSLSNKLGKEIRVGKNSLSKKGFQYLVKNWQSNLCWCKIVVSKL